MPDTTYPGPENIHRQVLDNGLVVLVYENFAAQSVVIEGVVAAGALAEPADKAGLADFTASLLMRGTENYSFDDVYEKLESVNARLSFSGDIHVTGYSAAALAEDLDLLLELVSESLCRPTFPAVHVERVRGESMTGLQMRANDTRAMAELAFYELLYNDHPYGRSPDGYPETLSNIDRADLVEFHRRYYGPEGSHIVIVGAVNAAEAVERVAAWLGDWRNAEQAPMPVAAAVEQPGEVVRRHVTMPDKTQSDIVLGLAGPPRSVPDYLDLSLMNTILGVFGMMGRLGKSVREEQGLAYYIHSRLEAEFGPAPWYVSTGVAPDKVEQAIDSIRREIGRMRDEAVPADELADSQAFRTGSLPVRLETNRGLAVNIASMEMYNLGLDYLQKYPDLINEITPERVQAAAQKYLSSDQLAIAVAGPQDG